MKATEPREKFCPWGRVSIQQISAGGIEVVPGGAFNSTFTSDASGDGGTSPRPASPCYGPTCVYYRKAILPWRWGRCSLSRDAGAWGLWIVAGMLAGLLAPCMVDFLEK